MDQYRSAARGLGTTEVAGLYSKSVCDEIKGEKKKPPFNETLNSMWMDGGYKRHLPEKEAGAFFFPLTRWWGVNQH